ncbi:universal stress protein [Sandaracinobacteroides saxicola]|uniref:Universal stress protein n=1 Tax=Sandaracinobacteroides saxicola TaxID=2759707 RepID=A0A7G5IM02_9SPHN|nr:universal stress protein [Sandaracinobacteroides saxicola]QMW24394.1 universal stress protein [Sandaracinobacteroides saxicola]
MSEAETYLVVIDSTPESRLALRYAALRASHVGAQVKLLHVIEPARFIQWGGVQAAMEAEAEEAAELLLGEIQNEVTTLTGKRPEAIIRRGKAAETVLAVVKEDDSIRALVLAAAAKGSPGPLIDFFSGEAAGSMPCLVMIVPGGIGREALDRLA